MDQNQVAGSPDNDLQKAIDNITNQNSNTNLTSSDPVAAPSSIPDGDNGELGEPVGPFPMPETDTKVGVITQGPEPIAPIEPLNLPELNVPGENVADAKVVTKPDASAAPSPFEPDAPNTEASAEPSNEPAPSPAPAGAPAAEQPLPTVSNPDHAPVTPPSDGTPTNDTPMSDSPNTPSETETPTEPSMPNPAAPDNDQQNPFGEPGASNDTFGNDSAPSAELSSDTLEIKKAILKDLTPILEQTGANASQKFKIYQDTMEDLHDYSVLDNAYKAASDIQDEKERADSLLYLLESIDSM